MNNGIIKLEDFQNDLKLSLGGEKNYYFGFSIQEFMDTQGSIGTYWSSSPANSEIYAYALHVDP
jgi:hypothetical protein